MDIRFVNPVVFVKDISLSKTFYQDVLGLKILQDFPAFVLFENHFSIHDPRELLNTVFGNDPGQINELQGKNNLLLYFESDHLDEAFEHIKDRAEIIHPIVTQFWGQRVFRFYDPDHHIVEIGEPM